jgi:hypothetical protein
MSFANGKINLRNIQITNPDILQSKVDLKANLVTFATTAADGCLCYASNEDKQYVVRNGALVEMINSSTAEFNIGNGQIYKAADGKVGIGTSSVLSAAKLAVNGGRTFLAANGETLSLGLAYNTSRYNSGHAVYIGATDSATPAMIFSNEAGTERMRIDPSGNVNLGKPAFDSLTQGNSFGLAPSGTGYNESVSTNAGGTTSLWFMNRQTSDGSVIQFRRANVPVGSISVTSSGTTYSPSSDRRLKENITPITNAIDSLMKLSPVTYNWKVNGLLDDGFIAQDLQEIPEFVNRVTVVGKIEEEDYYGVDYMRFTPLLTAAIQELKTELDAKSALVESLQTDMAALVMRIEALEQA